MVIYVIYSAFDAKNAASFSFAIMNGLLRGRFGYAVQKAAFDAVDN